MPSSSDSSLSSTEIVAKELRQADVDIEKRDKSRYNIETTQLN